LPVAKFATPNNRLRLVISQAIEAAFLTQPELARAAGITYHALKQYRQGARTPPPEVASRLAKALREQGGKLKKLAGEIERLTGEQV
jgi:transcriptional regulator with XRE-family HTH domain